MTERLGSECFQSYFFECDFSKCVSVSESFNCVENFNAGKSFLGVIVNSNSFRKVLSSYSRFLKSNIEGIYFRVICYMHASSSLFLKIVNIHGYYHDFIRFFHKNRSNLLCFIRFFIPNLIEEIKVFSSFKAIRFNQHPFGSFDGLNNFFFSGSSGVELTFCVSTEPNWDIVFVH